MKKLTFLVAALCATMFATAQTNLVANPSFEEGTVGELPTDYTNGGKAGFQISTEEAKDGSNSVKCTTTNARLEQEVTVEVGKSYTMSFWYTGYEASNTNGFKNYSLIDAATSSSYIDKDAGTAPAKLAAASEWTQYSKTFTATSTTMKISLRAYETVYIDQVSVVCNDCGGTTAIESVEMSNIYAHSGRIYGAEQGRIYTINGMDVTEQNGQLSNGIYIVKVGAKATKIAVK